MIWLASIQFLLNAFLAFLAFHVTFYPVDKERSKVKIRVYYFFIIACILGSGFITFYQSKDEANKEADAQRQQQNQQDENDKGKKELSAKLDVVATNLAAVNVLRQQYEDLVTFVLTNKSTSPEARQVVIASDEKFQTLNSKADDFNAWLVGLNGKLRDLRAADQIEHEKQIEETQKNYIGKIQSLNYAINSFTNLFNEVAAAKNDKMNLVFNGLPQSLNFPNGADSINVAKLKLEKNSGWDFDIILVASGPELFINGKDSSFTMNVSDGHGVVNIPEHTFEFHFPSEDCKTSIIEDLGYILANQEDKNANTNR